ncbi:DsbA family protein [Pseudomonas chlororaphis]|uniref:Protein-disulfide isomerase n=1 Tax=Pseudomonas chlororaphis TaxID=587753 RepID=A0A0D5XYH0_9PSED|nr:DsbA family protein [Pseudomonas chlororaphis]AKA24118.1 protein-disulfide isomerase [Pseudomonas chlororaphis]
MNHCDPISGACLLSGPDQPADTPAPRRRAGLAVHYIGDPMCSWCWGISPVVHQVAAFCEAQGIEFSITAGGLRAGGGDPWDAHFKRFLGNEWKHIAQVTGQPFGFSLLAAAHFDYDTEPACRAVAVVKSLLTRHGLAALTVLSFFSAVQRKFYVEGEDPKLVDFYMDICAGVSLDFAEFRALFESPEARQLVQQEFARCRQWGVRSFPTLLFERDGLRAPLAVGAVSTEQVLARLNQALGA